MNQTVFFRVKKDSTHIDPRAARQAKLKHLRASGVNPWPTEAVERQPLAEIKAHCEAKCPKLGDTDASVLAASGRIRALRGQGKIVFLDLEDQTAKMQIVAKEDVLGESQKLIDDLDIGDIIWVEGPTFRTNRGECSLKALQLKLLAKSLRPLPDKWHGLKDHEQRYRQRYLDLIMNPEVRALFIQRSRFINLWREALIKDGYTEVETPVLEHIPGGADAEPFKTRHRRLNLDLYLRISLELHLKRLLVGGMEKVFEIGRVFRNEGLSPQHLQEFTMLEFYWAYADYEELMSLVERLYAAVVKETTGSLIVKREGQEPLDFTPPWPRVRYVDLLKKRTGIDVATATDKEIVAAATKHHLEADPKLGRARLIDQLYKKVVRPHLSSVQFLIDPPLALSPLAKPHRQNPDLAERFWVLADGAEIGNGFSELNDPIDQKERFAEQEKLRRAGDAEAQRMDHDYIQALEYGLPPAAGFGVGLDRMLATITDQPSIRDVVLFPTMRPPEKSAKTEKE